jgi:hypothetical protein
MKMDHHLKWYKMAHDQRFSGYSSRDWIIGTVSAGLFLIIVGAIFINTPALFDRIIDFFNDFTTVKVSNLSIYLPAPANPASHTTVYSAAMQFSLVWGITQIGILIFRFALHSPSRKKAEIAGNAFYWLVSSYAVQKLLIEDNLLDETKWFQFWTVIMMIIGASLIIRALFLAVMHRDSRIDS